MRRNLILLALLLSPFLMGDVAPVGSGCDCGGGERSDGE
jgi:hypothetical protein